MVRIDTEQFKKYYFEDKLEMAQIARIFGCCPGTLYKRVKIFGWTREVESTTTENLTGQMFNGITALEYIGDNKFGNAIWSCRCFCGKTKALNISAVKAGIVISCGCNKHTNKDKGCESISGGFWHRLIRSAMDRGYAVDITIEQAWEKYKQQSGLCAISGVPITLYEQRRKNTEQTASPDRKNSSLGYTNDNFQWVHKRVNRMKNILTEDELIFWMRKITEHNTAHPEVKIDTNAVFWE